MSFRMVITIDKSLDLVGHQVKRIVTLVIARVGRRYTSHHVIPLLNERCLDNYLSVILLLLVLKHDT